MVECGDAGTSAQAAPEGRAPGPDAEAESREWRISFFAKVVGLGTVLSLAFIFVSTHFWKKDFPYNDVLTAREDRFMDFFSVNQFSYDLDPYPTGTPYPPFALLTARCFAAGFDYSAHGSLAAFAARASLAGKVSYGVLALGFCAFFFTAIYRGIAIGACGRDWQRAIVLGASYPLLFLLERGNYVMVAVPFLFGFVHFYRRNRMLANVFLALAISTKVYPLLFLLLLVADRRWRDCITVVALTVAINLGALLFFHGGVATNTELFVRHVLSAFSKGYADGNPVVEGAFNLSFTNLVRVPSAILCHRSPGHLLRYSPAFTLAVLGSLYWALRRETAFWKKVLLITIAMIGLQRFSPDYNLVYLFIPVLLYLREAAPPRREDYFYLLCLGLLFVPKGYHVLATTYYFVPCPLTVQAFLNPLLLLGLFLRVLAPRSAAFVLGGGSLALLGGIAFCALTARTYPALVAPAVARPEIGMTGFSLDGWVLRDGFTLSGPTDMLRRHPVLCLRGPNRYADELGGKLPGVRATLVIANHADQPIPATLVAEGDEYLLTLEFDPNTLPLWSQAAVRVTFDSWFVPLELGVGEDMRELVLPAPRALSLLPPRVWPPPPPQKARTR